MKEHTLPDLPYEYNGLEPYISEEQLTLHHSKHHQAYINGVNAGFEKLEKARKENIDIDMKAVLKELSFNLGGNMLHSYFWKNMQPKKEGNKPEGEIEELINEQFGNFDRFKTEFSKTAVSVEGSGWAALSFCKKHKRLLLTQIEKHNTNLFPNTKILLVLDVWEHAYYLDYKNERQRFVDGFWDIVNWDEVNKRLEI